MMITAVSFVPPMWCIASIKAQPVLAGVLALRPSRTPRQAQAAAGETSTQNLTAPRLYRGCKVPHDSARCCASRRSPAPPSPAGPGSGRPFSIRCMSAALQQLCAPRMNRVLNPALSACAAAASAALSVSVILRRRSRVPGLPAMDRPSLPASIAPAVSHQRCRILDCAASSRHKL
jgi:hypothetical protein